MFIPRNNMTPQLQIVHYWYFQALPAKPKVHGESLNLRYLSKRFKKRQKFFAGEWTQNLA